MKGDYNGVEIDPESPRVRDDPHMKGDYNSFSWMV